MFLVFQIPETGVAKYASQILSVIVALIEDTEEEVALEAVQGLGKVRFTTPKLVKFCLKDMFKRV